MPSQPDETPAMDLAHVIQYAQLASMLVCRARQQVLPTKRRVTLTIQEENELLGFLEEIEARAIAARTKLALTQPPAQPPALPITEWLPPVQEPERALGGTTRLDDMRHHARDA